MLDQSRVYLSWFRISKNNIIQIDKSHIINGRLSVNGAGNQIIFDNCQITDTTINISGKNNILSISKGVKLRMGNIIIRGSNCMISIDEQTTFGNVRIINVGTSNKISIGKECLFSDQIEIWASDTHAIYDDKKIWINKEQPITIGNGVWVGSKVTILKGVTIADGAIIGMGTILTKSVAAKTIVAGNPAKVIRENICWKLEYPNGK